MILHGFMLQIIYTTVFRVKQYHASQWHKYHFIWISCWTQIMSNTNNMNKTRNTYNTQGSKNESNVVLHGNHSEHHNRELKYVKTCYWTNLTSCSLLFRKKQQSVGLTLNRTHSFTFSVPSGCSVYISEFPQKWLYNAFPTDDACNNLFKLPLFLIERKRHFVIPPTNYVSVFSERLSTNVYSFKNQTR